WSDLMILLPSWTAADRIADQVRRAGVACVVEGGRQFFARDEVRQVMALSRALIEPGDAESLAFVLRAVFAVSFEELARHVGSGGTLRYTIAEQPEGPVREAFALLRRLHLARGERSLPDLVWTALREARALHVWALLPDGDRRLANLDKALVLLHEAELEA